MFLLKTAGILFFVVFIHTMLVWTLLLQPKPAMLVEQRPPQMTFIQLQAEKPITVAQSRHDDKKVVKPTRKSANKPAPASKPKFANKPVPASKPKLANKPTPASKPKFASKPVPASKPKLANKAVPASKPKFANEPVPASKPKLANKAVPVSKPKFTNEPVPASKPKLANKAVPASKPKFANESVAINPQNQSNQTNVGERALTSDSGTDKKTQIAGNFNHSSTLTGQQLTKSTQSTGFNLAYLYQPKPPYTAILKRLNAQGVVELKIIFAKQGHVKQISIAKSSGSSRLDNHALQYVKKYWRYDPPEKLREWTKIAPIRFSLQ